jgi:nucleotide-binding universal stress UspA family protein
MRILIAANDKPFSACAVKEAAKIAGETWADVRLLGIIDKNAGPHEKLLSALRSLEKDFLAFFEGRDMDSPYTRNNPSRKLIQISPGIYEDLYVLGGAMKDLSIRFREGGAAKEIIAESAQSQSDLIIMGCPKNDQCTWPGENSAPQKVASDAGCSVLVVKEEKHPEKIVCCLDHDYVSQESLEMINQMISVHGAELELVGITDSGSLKEDVDRKMNQVLKYYQNQHIKAWIKLVDAQSLDDFISQAARKDLIALWMGKKSLFHKLFPKQRVNRLINGAQSSVLILR